MFAWNRCVCRNVKNNISYLFRLCLYCLRRKIIYSLFMFVNLFFVYVYPQMYENNLLVIYFSFVNLFFVCVINTLDVKCLCSHYF